MSSIADYGRPWPVLIRSAVTFIRALEAADDPPMFTHMADVRTGCVSELNCGRCPA